MIYAHHNKFLAVASQTENRPLIGHPDWTKGSIRFDVVLLTENNIPICAWDFKTGSARLTEERIRTMLKKSGLDIPIIEIR